MLGVRGSIFYRYSRQILYVYTSAIFNTHINVEIIYFLLQILGIWTLHINTEMGMNSEKCMSNRLSQIWNIFHFSN